MGVGPRLTRVSVQGLEEGEVGVHVGRGGALVRVQAVQRGLRAGGAQLLGVRTE